jgi:hypothetical protein
VRLSLASPPVRQGAGHASNKWSASSSASSVSHFDVRGRRRITARCGAAFPVDRPLLAKALRHRCSIRGASKIAVSLSCDSGYQLLPGAKFDQVSVGVESSGLRNARSDGIEVDVGRFCRFIFSIFASRALRGRQKLVSKLLMSGELVRDPLLERTVRHAKDCPKCARGEGHSASRSRHTQNWRCARPNLAHGPQLRMT